MKEKIKKRLKEFSKETYYILGGGLLFLVFSLIMVVYLIIALVTHNSMFGSNNTANPEQNDIVLLITFSITAIGMLALIIYNLVFRKFEKMKPVDKNIVGGRVVTIKEGKDEHLKDILTDKSSRTVSGAGIDSLKKKLSAKKTADEYKEDPLVDLDDDKKE